MHAEQETTNARKHLRFFANMYTSPIMFRTQREYSTEIGSNTATKCEKEFLRKVLFTSKVEGVLSHSLRSFVVRRPTAASKQPTREYALKFFSKRVTMLWVELQGRISVQTKANRHRWRSPIRRNQPNARWTRDERLLRSKWFAFSNK